MGKRGFDMLASICVKLSAKTATCFSIITDLRISESGGSVLQISSGLTTGLHKSVNGYVFGMNWSQKALLPNRLSPAFRQPSAMASSECLPRKMVAPVCSSTKWLWGDLLGAETKTSLIGM